jgi:dihydrolipoamide dehydrogenase
MRGKTNFGKISDCSRGRAYLDVPNEDLRRTSASVFHPKPLHSAMLCRRVPSGGALAATIEEVDGERWGGALGLSNSPRIRRAPGAGWQSSSGGVYRALGAKVTVVELMDQIIPGVDKDIVTPLMKRIPTLYENIYLKAKVTKVEAGFDGLSVYFEGGKAPERDVFDKILVAVGRRPNGKLIGVENAGIAVDERGFIPVDKQMRTNLPHIFAIGDIVGQPMLAHKATHEGKVAAETAAGKNSFFDAKVIPSVAYTDPEVAWAGLTENEAKARGIKYGKGLFPWAASGRSLSLGRDDGITKVLFAENSHQIIG